MYQRHRLCSLSPLSPCAKVASLECTGDGVITSGASSSADRGGGGRERKKNGMAERWKFAGVKKGEDFIKEGRVIRQPNSSECGASFYTRPSVFHSFPRFRFLEILRLNNEEGGEEERKERKGRGFLLSDDFRKVGSRIRRALGEGWNS